MEPAPSLSASLQLLDDPEQWGGFSVASQEQDCVWESLVMVEGMHCATCSLNIEAALQQVPGVLSSHVSAASNRARVVWRSDQCTPSQWFTAIGRAGYRALPASDMREVGVRQRESRQLLWRLGVAGFCMMQVMMYAWPAYTAKPGDLSLEMEQLLRWASWVLSLPVMLFSCAPFFRNAYQDLRMRQISMDLPVALGIAITFIVSTAGTFAPAGEWGAQVYFDSLTMFVFFLLGGRWLELRIKTRTAGVLTGLLNRLPDGVVRRLPSGRQETVAAHRLRVGDSFKVMPGEAFAADGVVEEGSTKVDESLLTGESTALSRSAGEPVIAGSFNLQSMVWVRASGVGASTRFGQIVGLMEQAASTKPRSVQLVDRLARPFLWGVLLAAALVCALWWSQGPERAVMVAVSVLVVTCPCALSLATPAALIAAAGGLAKEGVLVRDLKAIDELAHIDAVVFDKTGTLTEASHGVTHIACRDGVTADQALQWAAALAGQSMHPFSRALWAQAQARQVSPLELENPVVEQAGAGLRTSWAALGELRLGSADFCGLNSTDAQGSVADAQVHMSDARGWVASFELGEQLRESAQATVASLRQAGVAVYLLSGDRSTAVERVAGQLGIADFRSGVTPEQKLAFMRELQLSGKRVAMVGDGLNDGPVLAGADAAFAIGKAVPVAQAKSDFVVLGSKLEVVAHAMRLAQATQRVVRQNLLWAVLYNAACIPLSALGFLPAWLAGLGMAVSSVAVIANASRLSSSVQRG